MMESSPSYRPTLDWLTASIRVNSGAGSSAYYHLLKGWSLPYPETTGYIIPTLLKYCKLLEEPSLFEDAESCARWLVSIQNEEGWFPAGLGGKGGPIIFDTAMILFGLTDLYEKTRKTTYLNALQKGTTWLLDQLDPAFRWTRLAYTPGYEPAYYTMVVWALLYADRVLKKPGLKQKMAAVLDRYQAWINPNAGVADWSFHPNSPALTHTVGYTWQGFLESGLILGDEKLLEKCRMAGASIVSLYLQNGRIAGTYNQQWKGDFTYKCLTGQAQFALFLQRLAELTGEKGFQNTGIALVNDLQKYPSKLPLPGVKGGIAGSSPIWGPYQRFRYLNWAAKFYLDAVFEVMLQPEDAPGREGC